MISDSVLRQVPIATLNGLIGEWTEESGLGHEATAPERLPINAERAPGTTQRD